MNIGNEIDALTGKCHPLENHVTLSEILPRTPSQQGRTARSQESGLVDLPEVQVLVRPGKIWREWPSPKNHTFQSDLDSPLTSEGQRHQESGFGDHDPGE